MFTQNIPQHGKTVLDATAVGVTGWTWLVSKLPDVILVLTTVWLLMQMSDWLYRKYKQYKEKRHNK